MKNKKAVSNVVSTVLIILVVVAAIAIITVILIRFGNNSSNQIQSSVLCRSFSVTPTQCIYNNTDTYGLFNLNLPNNSTLINLSLIFNNKNGDSTLAYIAGSNLAQLASRSFSFSSTNALNPPVKFSMAAVVRGSDGKPYACPASIQINCNLPYSSSGATGNNSIPNSGQASYVGGGSGGGSGGSLVPNGGSTPSSVAAPQNLVFNSENSDWTTYSVFDSSTGNATINFSWQDNSNNEDGFYIDLSYGDYTSGSWGASATKVIPYAVYGSNVNSATMQLPVGNYTARVYAFSNTIGNSSYSNDVSFSLINTTG